MLSTFGLGKKLPGLISQIFFISNFQLDITDNLPYFEELNFEIIQSATSFWNIKTKHSNQKLLSSMFKIHLHKISVEIL